MITLTNSDQTTTLQVGSTVYMKHLCEVTPVGGSDEGMCLRVSHASGKYLVTLPAMFCIHGEDGSFTWPEDAAGHVLAAVV